MRSLSKTAASSCAVWHEETAARNRVSFAEFTGRLIANFGMPTEVRGVDLVTFRTRTIACAVATLTWALGITQASPSAADPAAFVERFTGVWSGGGMVMEEGMERPQRVSCRLEGRGGPAAFTMAGRCRAVILVSRAIAASVAYDPATGQFRGTYVGSRAGTAQLVGQQHGDALQLSVVWPRPVHGDPRGRMTIVAQGDNVLRIVVEHPFSPAAASGQTIRSADLVLTRQ